MMIGNNQFISKNNVPNYDDPAFKNVLQQLFQGNDRPFIQYIENNKITKINLNKMLPANRVSTMLHWNEIEQILTATAKTQVTRIDFTGQSIYGFEDETIRLLAGSQIVEVRLSATGFSRDNGKLARALAQSKIESIDLSWNYFNPKDLADFLNILKVKKFRSITLDGNIVKEADEVCGLPVAINSRAYRAILQNINAAEVIFRKHAVDDESLQLIIDWAKTNSVEKIDLGVTFGIKKDFTMLFDALPQTNLSCVVIEGKKHTSEQQLVPGVTSARRRCP